MKYDFYNLCQKNIQMLQNLFYIEYVGKRDGIITKVEMRFCNAIFLCYILIHFYD